MQNPTEHSGEHQVFEKIWERTGLFYNQGHVRDSRNFPELWETVKFRRLDEFLPAGPRRSLEVGCGSGGVSLYLHNTRGYQVDLVDLSDQALLFARRNFAEHPGRQPAQARFLKGDATCLPYPDGSFDVVMSFGLLEHFTDIGKPLAEQLRVLRPGGVLWADIVTERFSVDIFPRLPGMLKKAARTLLAGRLAELGQARRADFYENRYSLETYVQTVERLGATVKLAQGNRPVTSFGRLPLISGLMLKLYQTDGFQRAWRAFDLSNSAFARWWGAGWWLLAVKR